MSILFYSIFDRSAFNLEELIWMAKVNGLDDAEESSASEWVGCRRWL